MPDVAVHAGTPGAPAQTPPETGHQAGSAVPPTALTEGDAPLTRKDLEASENRIFAALRRSSQKPAPPTEPPTEPETAAPTLGSLQSEVRLSRQENARITAELAQERRDNAIAAAIAGQHLSGEDAVGFRALLLDQAGARIKVEGRDVFVEADDGTRRPISEVARDLFGKYGRRFQPATQLPAGSGLGSSPSGNAGGAHPWSSLPFAEIQKRAQDDPARFAEYLHHHREEYDAKKRAARA